MTHTRNPLLKALTGAALAAVVLTGCQAIPISGNVHQGLSDLSQAQQQVQYRPDMPMPDASREEIVRGFLQAASSATDDYAIARQFLTSDYEMQWDPYQSVLIDGGTVSYGEPSESMSLLTLSGIAWIDEQGVLTQIEPGEQIEVAFELREEGGEWRISSAPNGVILDRTTFMDVWSQHQLYFGTSSDRLAADGRWFLNRATMSTHIVARLLEGPSPTLEGVARSGFASGTALATDAVLIDAGTARIDITQGFENLPPSALALAEQQLATSLNSVPGITSFIVTVNQIEVMSGAVMSPQSLDEPETREANYPAMLMHEGEFGDIRSSGFQMVAGLTEQLSTLAPTAITLDVHQQNAAVLTAGGAWWATPNQTFAIDERRGLLAPTIDPDGYVWTATATQPEQITVQRPGDPSFVIEVPWMEGLEVAAMRVSPGGNTLALLVEIERGTQVIVSGITREATGLPTGVVDPQDQIAFWVQGQAIDLDWVDAVRVVSLSRTDPVTTKLTIGGLGMFSEERAGVSGAVSLRGGGRSGLIQLLNENGDLWAPQGTTGWQRQFSDADLLSKRG